MHLGECECYRNRWESALIYFILNKSFTSVRYIIINVSTVLHGNVRHQLFPSRGAAGSAVGLLAHPTLAQGVKTWRRRHCCPDKRSFCQNDGALRCLAASFPPPLEARFARPRSAVCHCRAREKLHVLWLRRTFHVEGQLWPVHARFHLNPKRLLHGAGPGPGGRDRLTAFLGQRTGYFGVRCIYLERH